ncbi:MAG: SGNH/GDSL hydrolase family protein [Phycisphaeraceae bacterium]|nr:SGNH/GDSL hydrolase family protein [Phycisphaeraceae bacterium]
MNTQPLKVFVKRTITPLLWKWQDRRRDLPVVNVLGDSHVRYFRHLQQRCPLEKTLVRVFGVTGATASGMTNPASKTRALPAIQYVLARIPRRQFVVFSLGEVDVGFIVPLSPAPGEALGKACGHYLHFVDDVVAMGFAGVWLATVPPPVIEDWSKWPGPVAHLRKQVTTSLADRCGLAQRFNAMLREGQSAHGYRFLDVEDQFTDHTGRVRPQMISPRPGDLHLNNDRAAAIYHEALRREGFA